MKKIILTTALFIFIGCGSNAVKPQVSPAEILSSVQCENDDLRGFGAGASEAEALNAAHSALAKQIYSSVKVSENYSQSQQVTNGQENLSSDYRSHSVVEAVLLNAHDARTLRVERGANETGAVVCMSRANAAKGFSEKQKLVADSLYMACRMVSKYPKQKDEIWHRVQALWNEFSKVQNILEGFGAANAEMFKSVSETYSKTREERVAYCQTAKLHWEDSGNECSEMAFSVLSGKAKIEKSQCSDGLKLNFICGEPKCSSVSFGIKCVLEPSLSVEACNGERFSQLRTKEPVSASDVNSEKKARVRIFEELKKASFFNEWENEIKEWMPQCVD